MQPNPPPPPRGTGLKLQTPLNHFTFGLSGTTGHVVSGSDPLRQHPPPTPQADAHATPYSQWTLQRGRRRADQTVYA